MSGATADRADELAALEFFAGCAPESLRPLASQLQPLFADPGQVLMRQGETALTFLLIATGQAEVTHVGDRGESITITVDPGLVIGEIALLRHTPRSATVVAATSLTGWVGGPEAFAALVELPGVMPRLVRTARQRLAAYLTPIEIALRDHLVLHLRPVLPGDNVRTIDGPIEFSAETLYRRFQSTRVPTPSLMAYLFEVDYVDHFVWVMTAGPDGPVVADARFVREGHGVSTAEVAFIVADIYQGHGIGTFLMDALAVAAHVGGVTRFSARVLTDNYAMRAILDRAGAHWVRDDLNVVVTEIDVPPAGALSLRPEIYDEIAALARRVMGSVG
ncbi:MULTISPECIES: GNAT family N-acetyltransferase [Mycolicibacterium]|uniref:Cyclic nucleotide-binding protein n=1 Tax=Mycolicibacterium neoaurum TaxID=1795 RepID=A0AAV2WMQ4_MYCNE|nr:GNAT family N-acetyltransferase [Mycolicibacterium neoaurum]TLH57127.1 GNAT family N-acetyltransferase [Mycolicibacterium neoaurum]CDQ45510.1 cyclic nucleotide-binding protein [Mycolicibacterium neoaurum]